MPISVGGLGFESEIYLIFLSSQYYILKIFVSTFEVAIEFM